MPTNTNTSNTIHTHTQNTRHKTQDSDSDSDTDIDTDDVPYSPLLSQGGGDILGVDRVGSIKQDTDIDTHSYNVLKDSPLLVQGGGDILGVDRVRSRHRHRHIRSTLKTVHCWFRVREISLALTGLEGSS